MARRNLLAEKGRFGMSMVGVAVAVLLVLVVLALYRGFSRTGETFGQLTGDLWIVQQGTTDPFHSLSLLRESDLESARAVPGVAAVVPVLTRQMSFSADGREASARLMALGFPPTLPSDPQFATRYLPPPGVMVIDETLARKARLSEGDSVAFGPVSLTIGEVQPKSAEVFEPFAFVSYEDASRIFGIDGLANFGMALLSDGARAEDVSAAVVAAGPGLDVLTADRFAKAIRKEIDESFLPIIAILLAIGFTVGAAVVGLTIYTATIERSREFGVLKAVGASGVFLYRIVAAQSAFVSSTGFFLGLGGALLVAYLAETAVPDFATDFRTGDVIAVLLGTVVMAFAASLAPVRRIESIDPAMVFKA